jgi:hypothetical protein
MRLFKFRKVLLRICGKRLGKLKRVFKESKII